MSQTLFPWVAEAVSRRSTAGANEESERRRIEEKFRPAMREELKLDSLVSFIGNKTVPILRLYRYKEAFAFEFVRHFLRRLDATPADYVFDPFAGMGTALFASMVLGNWGWSRAQRRHRSDDAIFYPDAATRALRS